MKKNKLLAFGIVSLYFAGCADQAVYDGGAGADGLIRFTVDGGDGFTATRGGDPTGLTFHGTAKIPHADSCLYLHIESTENILNRQVEPTTRAMPLQTANLGDFTVTATVDEDGRTKTFMNEVTATKNGKFWTLPDDYYWPEGEMTVYAENSGEHAYELTAAKAGGKIKFRYTVPSGNGTSDVESQKDIILATHKFNKKILNDGTAAIRFRHPLTGICVAEKPETYKDDENLRIAKVELSGFYGAGECEFNSTNQTWSDTQVSNWTLSGSNDKTYVHTVDMSANEIEVPVTTGMTRKCVSAPFMIVPHTKAQLKDAKLTVTLKDGKTTKEVLLKDIEGFQAGRIYVLTLSGLDANYPPVENLQGMAGNNTVSLTWDNPEPSWEHVKQCGYTVKVTQKNSKDKSIPESTVTYVWRWGEQEDAATKSLAGSNNLLPDLKNTDKAKKGAIDLFAYIKEDYFGKDDARNGANKIDTRKYNEFVCKVYADYYNTHDDSYKNYTPATAVKDLESHQSVEKVVDIIPPVVNDHVMFYIPEGAGTAGSFTLLDDDDIAAADWFRDNFTNFHFVDKNTLPSTAENIRGEVNAGNLVLWVPCGVQIAGTEDVNQETVNTCNTWIANDSEDAPLKSSFDEYKEKYRGTFNSMAHFKGLYNDPTTGQIKSIADQSKYFTTDDMAAIKAYYLGDENRPGGNLLLTTFSIYYIFEMGVIPNAMINKENQPFDWAQARPAFALFNEIKLPSIWFVNGDFGGHSESGHPIYSGLFKCVPDIFPETKLEDDRAPGYDYNHDGEYPAFVGGIRGKEMFPLLSMGSKLCENNNCDWDFNNNKQGCSMADYEKWAHARFIGTWGQIEDESVAVVCEFYPGLTDKNSEGHYNPVNKTHGRCIAIGLGAYEFNNGTVYDKSQGVLNMYQSNVEKMTKNAIEYLLKVDPTVESPIGLEDWTKPIVCQ